MEYSWDILSLNERGGIIGSYKGDASIGAVGTATLSVYMEDGTLLETKSVSIY